MTSRSYFGKMNSTLGSVVPLTMFFVFFEKKMHYFTSIWITGEVDLNVFAFKGIRGCRTSLQLENYILPKMIIITVKSDKPVKSWRGREYKVQSTKYKVDGNFQLQPLCPGNVVHCWREVEKAEQERRRGSFNYVVSARGYASHLH